MLCHRKHTLPPIESTIFRDAERGVLIEILCLTQGEQTINNKFYKFSTSQLKFKYPKQFLHAIFVKKFPHKNSSESHFIYTVRNS